MNREQIIEKWNGMTPCERDAWVAKVVFECPNVRKFREHFVFDNVGSLGSVMGTVDVPEYTTDISAAWKVVDTFFMFSVEGLANRYGYECTIWNEYSLRVSNAHGHNAPEAICLAAIIAKLADYV